MKDIQIREILKKSFTNRLTQNRKHLLIEEFSIANGSHRCDLVYINHYWHGFEIKSEQDTLGRLPQQQKAYSKVFDKITLVVSCTHALAAIDLIPDWWGLKFAEHSRNGTIRICNGRNPKLNPNLDATSLLELLWKEELQKLLKKIGREKGNSSLNKTDLYTIISENTPLKEVRNSVHDYLLKRLIA